MENNNFTNKGARGAEALANKGAQGLKPSLARYRFSYLLIIFYKLNNYALEIKNMY